MYIEYILISEHYGQSYSYNVSLSKVYDNNNNDNNNNLYLYSVISTKKPITLYSNNTCKVYGNNTWK